MDVTIRGVPKAVKGGSCELLEIRRHLDGNNSMCDFIKHTKMGISPTL